jgi:glucosamine--fructose-6-phosphate aminotransferase (isomerizing)
VVDALDEALDADLAGEAGLLAALGAVADALGRADALLSGEPGVLAVLADAQLAPAVSQRCERIDRAFGSVEARLDAGDLPAGEGLEALNAAVVRARDALWSISRDRLRAAESVASLVGPSPSRPAVRAMLAVHEALSALDRLEVRGRDSAGLSVLVRDHGLDVANPATVDELERRGADPLFGSGSVRVTTEGHLSFVVKAAAEIGELGDNTKALRSQLQADTLLRRALAGPDAQVLVLGHTRWASIGIISQANAHPLNAEELVGESGGADGDGAGVIGVLNGDVDNFADLKVAEDLAIAPEITTDAKVIPTLVAHRLAAGSALDESFRRTVNELEGSVAVAVAAAGAPADLHLALRGSGQALYVGVAEDVFVVASEPYGVIELTDTYLRMDGETPAQADNPASRGQIVRLHGERAGDLAGVERWTYGGEARPIRSDELSRAQITTRDIDRGDAPHYLLKEITEAPSSFRKTLRGKLVERDGTLHVDVGTALPEEVRERLADGTITSVLGIGQGTAAVAASGFTASLSAMVDPGRLSVMHQLATELSGFGLRPDMSNTLVVAVSQSGTTTDTNRTVDLVRARGAAVVAIVNRRGSDLTDKADGVLYTADGRDVEMSVASTKAFYSQIAAGVLLAHAVADEIGTSDAATLGVAERQEVLTALRGLPSLMERTVELRPAVADAAHRFAPSRRYWAIVGNGANRIAAQEVRIKLSELCYKSIACDGTEDKKHIDLSSEPMILVCAAGLSGSTADDVAKEVAIYRAHKAAPIVVATEGESRFGAAVAAVAVPSTHPSLAFVLSAMVGHLFGYEAALAIDAQARPLREARAAIESVVSAHRDDDPGEALLHELSDALAPHAAAFFDGLRTGDLDGHLEASTAVRLASCLRFALGSLPLDAYQVEHGKVGTPSVVIEDLTSVLTQAIDELTRPVDAIKHQAKTVTVGISRSDETLLQVPLVRTVLEAGVSRDRLSYRELRTLSAIEPLVESVTGYTRYRIEDDADGDGEGTIVVVDRGGIGRDLRSRTDENPTLRGTKHRVAGDQQVLLARGRSDGRVVVLVPEVKDRHTTGLTLLHVALHDDVPMTTLRSVLQGYRARYQALVDAVTETEPAFRDDLLTAVPVVELMTDPIVDLAERWRSTGDG